MLNNYQLSHYKIDTELWSDFCFTRNILGKYHEPEVLTKESRKLITFVNNDVILMIHINCAHKSAPPFVCTLFHPKDKSKTKSFSGHIFNISCQYRIEMILENYFLVNLPVC